ncbi:Replication-associated protein [Dirofilaria immitis]
MSSSVWLVMIALNDTNEIFGNDTNEIFGDPGIGKTSFATKISKSFFTKTANTEKWWDGYENQEVVILDDFYGWLSSAELFNLADSKPYYVQIKGGFIKFNSKVIVITSNKIPEHWWKRQTLLKYDMRAFDRRVTLTWHWTIAKQESYFGYAFNYNLTSD